MTAYLEELCEWVIELDIGSNVLKGNYTPTTASHHIFINGNFARVLLAGYKITGNETYLAEGLRWCDTLVSLQYHLETSTGEMGGCEGLLLIAAACAANLSAGAAPDTINL
eukprot:SAG31_NODE_4765_length_2970_cov_21.015640_2_plen_111_part_00